MYASPAKAKANVWRCQLSLAERDSFAGKCSDGSSIGAVNSFIGSAMEDGSLRSAGCFAEVLM
jgi:hypothetical protein